MTGWKNGRIGVTAHTLENLPWEESEGLPAEAAREPQARGPRPGGCKAAGSWEKRGRSSFHCRKQMTPRRSIMCRGPAPVDPGNSKGRGLRGSGNNSLFKC